MSYNGIVGGASDQNDFFSVSVQGSFSFFGGFNPSFLERAFGVTSSQSSVKLDRIGTRVRGAGDLEQEMIAGDSNEVIGEYMVRSSVQDFKVRNSTDLAASYRVGFSTRPSTSSWSPPTAVGDTVTVSGLANGATGEFVVVNLSGDEITRGYVAPGIETTFNFANNGIYVMLFSQANGKLISDYTRPENDPLRDPDGSYLKYESGGNYLRTGSGILYADVTVNGVRRTTDVPLAFAVGVVPEPATIIALSLGLAAILRKRKSK